MKELYCAECGGSFVHKKYGNFYCCDNCDSPNYDALKIDNPELHMELSELRNLEDKLIVETGFPF